MEEPISLLLGFWGPRAMAKLNQSKPWLPDPASTIGRVQWPTGGKTMASHAGPGYPEKTEAGLSAAPQQRPAEPGLEQNCPWLL